MSCEWWTFMGIKIFLAFRGICSMLHKVMFIWNQLYSLLPLLGLGEWQLWIV
jgi:hypothetical protein